MRFNTLIIAALLATAPAFGFDLKGIEVGKPFTPTVNKAIGVTTLAGVKADLNCFTNHHNIIEQVTGMFAASDFDAVNAAILAKYGKPDRIEKTPMRNGFGANFERVNEIWINEKGDSMQVVNLLSATRAAVVITSKARIDSEAAAAHKAKNDI